MSQLDVFQTPAGLADDLIKFYYKQECYELSHLGSMRELLNQYIGLYILFYNGKFTVYKYLAQLNKSSCVLPIYIGKASPAGRRTGVGSSGQSLYSRLREHSNSINNSSNLSLEDFNFKVVAMDFDLVSWGESTLIGHFKPIWNTIINGFGIHPPGSGRLLQEQSTWDQLHPGRNFASALPVHSPIIEQEIKKAVENHCKTTVQK